MSLSISNQHITLKSKHLRIWTHFRRWKHFKTWKLIRILKKNIYIISNTKKRKRKKILRKVRTYCSRISKAEKQQRYCIPWNRSDVFRLFRPYLQSELISWLYFRIRILKRSFVVIFFFVIKLLLIFFFFFVSKSVPFAR